MPPAKSRPPLPEIPGPVTLVTGLPLPAARAVLYSSRWLGSRSGSKHWLYVIKDSGRAGRTVVTISVTDLERFVAELGDRGISAGPIEAVGDAGLKANVVDADGNAISWIQVAAIG